MPSCSLWEAVRAAAALLLAAATSSLVQGQCTFTLSPPSATVAAGGGTGSIGVTASAGCSWKAVSSAEWITVTFGASGTGDGTVGYAVPANPTLNPRSGTIAIGGQTFTLTQSGGACTFSLSPGSATVTPNGGAGSFNVIATAGCSWTATSSAGWLTITSGSGNGSGTASYAAAPNPSPSVRTAVITVGSQTFTVVQSAACSLTLAPAGVSVPAAGATGSVNVTANSSSCDRSAASTVPWITISFGASGTGNGAFGYTVAPNTTGGARSGTVSVGNQTFTVYQEAGACTIVIAPAWANLEAKGGAGAITVAATPGCNWAATPTADWITITYGATGVGDGGVGYAVPANTLLNPRSGAINIGSQAFSIMQAGTSCSYSLSPGSASISPSGGAGSFNVNATAGCGWNALSNADWFVITAGSGSGPGTVSYLAAPNTGPTTRTASVNVATQTFTATQAAACTLALSPASLLVPASVTTGSVTVTASSSSCDRSVVNPVTWISITSGATGTGSGSFGYSISVNNTGQVRTATLTVGGQGFSITQEATACQMVITPASPFFSASGGAASLSVTSTCAWTAATNSDWMTIISGASGTGNGTIRYAVAPNPSTESRAGSLSIGGHTFNIPQAGVGCTVTLMTLRASFPVAGGSGVIDVVAPAECSWTAVSGAPWILIDAGGTGAGNGSVSYTVGGSAQPQPRTGTITVANQVYTITQAAASCEFAIAPSSATVGSAGGTGSFTVTSNCTWTATTSARWITLAGASGSGEGTVSYTVAANPSADGRTAAMTVGGQTFTLVQSGVSCNVTLAPASADVAGSGGTGAVSVASGTGCKWTPASQADWIKITSWSNVSGAGAVQYSVAANPVRGPRTGTVAVSGQTFTVIQGPAEILLAATRVVNAASYVYGAVAAAEIVSLFGSFLGPPAPATLALSLDGKFVTTALAETRVFFDDVAAPMLYVSDTQVSAVVPYAVAGKTATEVKLEDQGLQSKPVSLKVAAAAPGLFTMNASGSGQGAILNQDYTPNSASNPAAKSSVVMLFATGSGQSAPAGVDGQIIAGVLPKPLLPVTVRIGGLDARVLYAGAAPSLVSGVLQVNAEVPSRAASGTAVPVVLRVGNFESQARVTMAVK